MKKVFVFLALFLFAAFCLSAQNAQELRLGGSPVAGTLNNGSEIWYSVRAASNGFLIVETTGDTDTYLEVYDAQRNLIMENDDGGEGANARIEMVTTTGRTYLFKLRGFASHVTGPYRIWASIDPIPRATELSFGTARQANLSEGAKDWYSVRTTAAGYIIAETSGNTVDTYMYAYDAQYNILTQNDDGGVGTNARIEILAEPNQTYFFMVRGFSNSESGSYTIFASNDPIPADTERNTDRSRAVPIKLGEAIPVYFRTTNESRWYRYEAPRNGAVFVVQTRGNLNTTLLLHDNRGNLITENDYSGENNNGLIHERLNPGTYFIEIKTSTNGAGTTGRCTLHAETR